MDDIFDNNSSEVFTSKLAVAIAGRAVEADDEEDEPEWIEAIEMDQSSDTMKSTNSIAETLRRKKQRERKLKKILQVLYTENNLDTFTMEVPIYIYIQSKRESMREIGNCLTRAVTDSHMYNTRNNRLTVNNITTHTKRHHSL